MVQDYGPRFFVKNKEMKKQTINPIWLLVSGVVLMAGTHFTYNIEILAWVSSIPFLLYLSKVQKSKIRPHSFSGYDGCPGMGSIYINSIG